MSRQYKSFEELLAEIDAAENPDLHLFEITIERARRKSIELAEALRYCAIPQRFNAEIISVLDPKHSQQASSLLKGLRDYEFVLEREKGWYVYHDNTRDLLLDDWRSADKQADFSNYNERLITYYEKQREAAKKAEADWRVVAPIILRANPTRYDNLATSVEQRLLIPLVEILYHKTLQSAKDGYDFFQEQCFELEQNSPTLCLSLLNITRNYLKLAAPKSTNPDQLHNLNLWLDYFEARLNQTLSTFNTQGLEKAKESLQTLSQKEEVQQDTKLYIWVLNELGSVLNNLAFYDQAYKAYDDSRSLSEKYNIDLYNMAVYYSNLAGVLWTKGELLRALEYYRKSVEEAKKEYNSNLEISSLSSQCNLLQDQGKWELAFNKSLELLNEVWTRFPQEDRFHSNVMTAFFNLLAGRDSQLLDSVFKGLNVLLEIQGDPRYQIDLHLRYINLLTDVGRIKQAEIELNECLKKREQRSNPTLEKELLYRQGSLYEDQGKIRTAIEKYLELLEHSQATGWDKAAANTNLGSNYIRLGEFDKAERHLLAAIKQWEQLGLDKLIAFSRIAYAELYIKQGKLGEAQKQLDICRESLFKEFHNYQMQYHTRQGMFYEAKGDWPAAHEQYERALEINLAFDSQLKSAAERYSDLARVAEHQAGWTNVVNYINNANRLWRRLRKVNGYRPTDTNKNADKFFANGLKALFTNVGELWSARLSLPQEQFKKAAKLRPENPLYTLYWMYTAADRKDWPEAIQAAGIIIDHGPEWVCHHPLIEARLVEFSLKHGAAELENEDYKKVIDLYKTTEQRLEHPAPLDQIAIGWLEFGDHQLEMGEPVEAHARYRSALKSVEQSQNLNIQAGCYARLGYLAMIDTRKDIIETEDRALSNFAKAIELYSRDNSDNPGIKLGEACKARIQGVETYWLLDSRWRDYIANNTLEKRFREELTVAREYLVTYLDERYRLSEQSTDTVRLLPDVTPITVEVDISVLPEGPNSEWELFKTYLPEMRARIEADMGIEVPGTRVRGNELVPSPGSYLIMLDEVPLIREYLKPGKVYCSASLESLEALQIPRSALIEKPHPMTATPGCWVDSEYLHIISDSGYEFWEDPLLFMIYHLEAVLRRNLANFLGIQEVETILENHAKTAEGEQQITSVLPDRQTRVHFARLLRTLVKENTPISNIGEILQAFRELQLNSENLDEAVRQIRLQNKSILSGNRPEVQRFGLPRNWEEMVNGWARMVDGKTKFTPPPDKAHNLIQEIDRLVPSPNRNSVLVVNNHQTRPFLRRLLENRFPDLMVMSAEELVEVTVSEDESKH